MAVKLANGLFDSGASRHMTPSSSLLQDLTPHLSRVCIGDKTSIPVHSEGSLDIIPDSRGSKHSSQVLYVPSLGMPE